LRLSHPEMTAAKHGLILRRLIIVLATVIQAACVGVDAVTGERAAAERAAIHHDLRHDTGTLYAIAAKRAKYGHPELQDKRVTCAISNVDIRFTKEWRAIYTVTYACGVVPWELGQTPPVATPTIKLELLKEGTTWMINSFL
jgi:hypothetical protein